MEHSVQAGNFLNYVVGYAVVFLIDYPPSKQRKLPGLVARFALPSKLAAAIARVLAEK